MMNRRPPRSEGRANRRPIPPPKAPTTRPQAEPTPPAEPVAPVAAGDRLVTLAVVTGAHGITGECRLKLFTDDLGAYPDLIAGGQPVKLASLRQGGNGAIARFEGVTDRNAAERLRGTTLSVPRSALPKLEPGEYYHSDLIGLPCVSSDGAALGEVIAVENFGAGDVIEIAKPDGATFMVPMKPDAVPEWDAERIVIDPVFVD